MSCAACGAKRVVRSTTFQVTRVRPGEFYLCVKCWGVGAHYTEWSDGDAWNERITQKILQRRTQPAFGLDK
jgi:hypothetical protein